jgi:hypothetical protein
MPEIIATLIVHPTISFFYDFARIEINIGLSGESRAGGGAGADRTFQRAEMFTKPNLLIVVHGLVVEDQYAVFLERLSYLPKKLVIKPVDQIHAAHAGDEGLSKGFNDDIHVSSSGTAKEVAKASILRLTRGDRPDREEQRRSPM